VDCTPLESVVEDVAPFDVGDEVCVPLEVDVGTDTTSF